MKIGLVILTYNEIIGLRHLFEKIPVSEVDEVFAVDGGSTDGTLEFFKERKITTHVQEVKGRGEAFRLAFRESSCDALIFFSPDGNEDPTDIVKFKPFLEDGAAMVIATRMTKEAHNEEDENFFKWRKWANNAFNLMANLTWNRGPFVYDAINGFRAITRSTWNTINLDGSGYTIEYQSTIRCFKNRLKIVEFPTFEAARIDDRVGSPSIPTGLAFVKLYFSELFSA